MLKINFELDEEQNVVTSFIPESDADLQQLKEALSSFDIENPALTYTTHLLNSIENQDEKKAISDAINNLVRCWSHNNRFLQKANPLFLLGNAMDALLPLERDNDFLKEKALTFPALLAPCFNFTDQFPFEFSIWHRTNIDKRILEETIFSFDHISRYGRPMADKQEQFVKLISKDKCLISMGELIPHLVQTLWEYYEKEA